MTNNQKNSPPKSKILAQKIGFLTLYKKFKFEVIRHFLITALRVISYTFLLGIIINIFKISGKVGNYADLLPGKKIWEWWGVKTVSKGQFVAGGLLFVLFFSIIYYWSVLWEEELRVLGGHYAKSRLLNKFRQLPFEEKQAKKDELNNLIEKDAFEIGYAWEHLPNHFFRSFLAITSTIIYHWDNFGQMSEKEIWFSFFWLGLVNLVVYWFTKKILHNEKEYKKRLDEEWKVINKEREKIILVEGMGLSSQYQSRQEKLTQTNKNLCLKFNRTRSLNKAFSSTYLVETFPFLLLFLADNNFQGEILSASWRIFENFGDIFHCLWDYADYAVSQERVNQFLNLPEKNDNLMGRKLNKEIVITNVTFQNVYFRYQGQSEWVLKNYNRTFTSAKLNRLTGKNGSGKSTILYLLLGIIIPQRGQIIITDIQGNNYNLHQDFNLQYWRENNVAYCAHDTLQEEGSTGQKQLANIDNVLQTKESATVFLFDEADNALDQDNQESFQGRIKELAKNKIVVYIKH